MYIIDAAQVRVIRDYRIRLDNDAQVAELLDLCARQTAVSALVIEVLASFFLLTVVLSLLGWIF